MRRFVLASLGALVLASAVATPPALAQPNLPWRGIVEGAYGRPWTHAERMDVLRWMAAHDFNAYVHAPKDDLYQRTQWRDQYPAAQQAEFEREIRLARRLGIEWVPNLSPALPLIPTLAVPEGVPSRDLCFSCPADLNDIVDKLRPFLAAGTRTVMISFDDVTKVMTHAEDLARYGVGDGAFGEANGDFLTRLRTRLREIEPRARVLTVGADYSGTAGTAYLAGLRDALAPGIEVMWTGTNVPSEHWTPADATAYGEAIGRTPVVWENWTNNDTAGNVTPLGTARLFLGPYLREPEAASAVRGFFFNPANEAYLNLLPLATAADWMADPRNYRPRASWLEAIRELAPGRRPQARQRRLSLRAWAETSWSNKLDREREAPTFVRAYTRLFESYASARWAGPFGELAHELGLVELAPLRLGRLSEPGIAEQAEEFLDAARTTAHAGTVAARLLAAERPSLFVERDRRGFKGALHAPEPELADHIRNELSAAATEATLDSEFTYGWRLPIAFEIPPYAVPGNVMDAFIAAVRALDQQWTQEAELAASVVTLTLDGVPVPYKSAEPAIVGGGFRVPRDACGGWLVATDGAGNSTGRRLPGC